MEDTKEIETPTRRRVKKVRRVRKTRSRRQRIILGVVLATVCIVVSFLAVHVGYDLMQKIDEVPTREELMGQ